MRRRNFEFVPARTASIRARPSFVPSPPTPAFQTRAVPYFEASRASSRGGYP
jgi:hypothetical protein